MLFLAITLFLYLSLISGYPQGNPQNNQGFLMGKKISRRDGTESFFGHLVDRAGKRHVAVSYDAKPSADLLPIDDDSTVESVNCSQASSLVVKFSREMASDEAANWKPGAIISGGLQWGCKNNSFPAPLLRRVKTITWQTPTVAYLQTGSASVVEALEKASLRMGSSALAPTSADQSLDRKGDQRKRSTPDAFFTSPQGGAFFLSDRQSMYRGSMTLPDFLAPH